ncbi:AAA family ATPase [Pseudomonas viridiflava]|uniref:AAA family ATPase n=1 Tax=Pseudomonas viridiflava TaxID=33069 RepID=UPI001FD3F107|nr:AAA family ATPase [Pseudomonas viridiflava]
MASKFLIRKPRGAWPKEGYPAFVLEQDKWNDYGFMTQYHLYYVTLDEAGDRIVDLIGPVKILRLGQLEGDDLQITEKFNTLDDDFCSVGSSLDYYERLRQLSKVKAQRALTGLRDLVHDPSLEEIFRDEPGWNKSLFRDGKDDKYLKIAYGLVTGDYTELPGEELSFSVKFGSWLNSLDFAFMNPKPHRRGKSILPTRVGVLVGANGSGKSTVLARIARLAFATIAERKEMASLGALTPAGIGFPRIVTISFSAFDSFHLPGSNTRNRRKILDEMASGTGRFAYVGLRDLKAEGSRVAKGAESEVNPFGDEDRQGATRLKSIEKIADEFYLYLSQINDPTKVSILTELFSKLLKGSVFEELEDYDLNEWDKETVISTFLKCSTGHKIAALVVTSLMAVTVPSSLVLFDEPETHLHPPLLAELMHAVRAIMANNNSFCIIASHSPVVVQETLGVDVRVIKRDGDWAFAEGVGSETFGESIGLITSEVFGLNPEATDYHRVLDDLIHRIDDQDDLEDLEDLFLQGQMSHQARSYSMSRRAFLKRTKK